MAGEIHGIISREDAWRMWAPYGERVVPLLDGSFDPDKLTEQDAQAIYEGSTYEQQEKLGDICQSQDGSGVARVRNDVRTGPGQQLVDLLAKSHQKQQFIAEKRRDRQFSKGVNEAKLLFNAARRLYKEGFFTPDQFDAIHNRIFGPDGTPFMQYTPMSKLEQGRYILQLTGYEPDYGGMAATDFNFGVIEGYITLNRYSTINVPHSKVHEGTHAFSGLELWDVTDEDDRRMPSAPVKGLFADTLNTGSVDVYDYSDVENMELNEGWTELVSHELMRVEPRLGICRLRENDSYEEYNRTLMAVGEKHPDVLKAITRAAMAESTPADPDAKRGAITEMRAYTDKKMGEGVLNRLLVQNGGDFLDYYANGKDKE